MWRLLDGPGSHDLSAISEALGMPERAIGDILGTAFLEVRSLLLRRSQREFAIVG